MALDLQQEREQAHALLDQLPPAKLRAVHEVLMVLVNKDASAAGRPPVENAGGSTR